MTDTEDHARRYVAAVLLLACLVIGLFPSQTQAQDAEPPVEYEIRAQGRLVADVLLELRSRYTVPLAWDPLLVASKRVFCAEKSRDFHVVLRCVLRGTGLVYEIQQTGTYTIRLATEGTPEYGQLVGLIVDLKSGQPIPNAEIQLLASADTRGRIANEAGIFQFEQLLPGSYVMRVRHLSYSTRDSTVAIRPGTDERTVVHMDARVTPMDLAIVDGMALKPSSRLGVGLADQEDVAGNMDLGTQAVLRSIDTMPGVRVNDANADVHIQGGGTGELQYRLDGAPIFMPLNVAAFIGPFSPFALKSITVHKAGFNATHGSQLSGVIDAEHDLTVPLEPGEPGGRNRFTVQVDPISTNGRYNAHWGQKYGPDGTFMSSARIGTWGIGAPASLQNLLADWNLVDTFLLSAFADQNTLFENLPPRGEASVGFFDWHNALRLRFDGFKTLSASTYWGSSSLGNDLNDIVIDPDSDPIIPVRTDLSRVRDIYSWQSGAGQVTYSSVLNNRATGSLKGRASYYRLEHQFVAPDSIAQSTPDDDGNRVLEVALEGRIGYSPGGRHFLESGLELIHTDSRFKVAGTQLLPVSYDGGQPRIAGFLQDRFEMGSNAVMEAGLRLTWLNARRTLYGEPRLSFRFDWKDTSIGEVALYVGSGLYRQYVSQFDISSRSPRTFVRSTRFWLATDHSVSPPYAGHLAAELMVKPSARWTIRLESHYKKLYHLLTLDYSAELSGISDSGDQSEFLSDAEGLARGFGIAVDREIGLGTASVRYDYSRSERTITNLFSGELVTVPWNEPHRLELGFDLVPISHMIVSTRWKSVFGRTWGYRQAYYDFLGAHLNNTEMLQAELAANGVSADAVARIVNQINNHDLTNPDGRELPALHQLDLTVAYTFPFRSFGIQVRADVVNVLNRTNVSEWRFTLDPDEYYGNGSTDGTGVLNRTDRPLLPRVVTAAVKVTW